MSVGQVGAIYSASLFLLEDIWRDELAHGVYLSTWADRRISTELYHDVNVILGDWHIKVVMLFNGSC